MTEQEIKENKEWLEDFIRAFGCNFDDLEKKSFDEIVVCLGELEKYRALGTVEEIRVARDKQVVEEFCEWKAEKDIFIQNPHTKRKFSNEPSMKNIYCNTCSKKIKIVRCEDDI